LNESFNTLKKHTDSSSADITHFNKSKLILEQTVAQLKSENKHFKEKLFGYDNKSAEMTKEIKDGYTLNKKLEIHNEELLNSVDKLNKENELLRKNKAQKEK